MNRKIIKSQLNQKHTFPLRLFPQKPNEKCKQTRRRTSCESSDQRKSSKAPNLPCCCSFVATLRCRSVAVSTPTTKEGFVALFVVILRVSVRNQARAIANTRPQPRRLVCGDDDNDNDGHCVYVKETIRNEKKNATKYCRLWWGSEERSASAHVKVRKFDVRLRRGGYFVSVCYFWREYIGIIQVNRLFSVLKFATKKKEEQLMWLCVQQPNTNRSKRLVRVKCACEQVLFSCFFFWTELKVCFGWLERAGLFGLDGPVLMLWNFWGKMLTSKRGVELLNCVCLSVCEGPEEWRKQNDGYNDDDDDDEEEEQPVDVRSGWFLIWCDFGKFEWKRRTRVLN